MELHARMGVTGERSTIDASPKELVARTRKAGAKNVCVGIGADRPTKAATNSASRFPTNRMEIPFPYLFLEIRHNGIVPLLLLGEAICV